MRLKIIGAAALYCLFGVTQGAAQSGPAEMPPAGFEGAQYVDSQGCVYLRAGYGGQLLWVSRLDAQRQPLCGYPPTFGAGSADAGAPEPEKPAAAAKPKPAKKAPPAVGKPVVKDPPRGKPDAPGKSGSAKGRTAMLGDGPAPGQIGCYKEASVPLVVSLVNGGSAVVCTRGDGTLSGWRPPIYPAGSAIGASLSNGRITGLYIAGNGRVMATTAPLEMPAPTAKAVDHPAPKVAAADPMTTAPKASAASDTGSAQIFVAVGTYGVPSNATGAVASLKALGLPTAKSDVTRNGRALQIIYAGPFSSMSAAQNALTAARGAGFGDAFIL